MVAITRADAPGENAGAAAQSQLKAATAIGWRGILDKHEASWRARWRAYDVVIEGDPAAQQALRFALYHLNGAANPDDSRVSIAARALIGADYHGHVFWDTETFLLPFYTLTWPEAARTLLTYRFRTLDGARAKAKRMGWRGAMYASESADTGAETCPEHAIGPDRRVVTILCGTQEQHITADVAYAVWHYWQATGDDAFLCEAGAEILQWASVADAMATGLDPTTGLYEQFAGFFKLETIDLAAYAGRPVPMDAVLGRERIQTAQIIKQADVVALMVLLPEEFAAGAVARNFSYYESRCSHGSSLSAALHGVAAARLGHAEMAMGFFRQASATDLADTHAAIDGGVHIAALGGLWMMAVLGFAGLTMDASGLSVDPHLPPCWQTLAFSVQWRGRHVSVAVDAGGTTIQATLTAGEPMTITIGGEPHPLAEDAPLSVPFASR